MAKITLNGVDALTESGGVVTIPGAANLVLGTDAVPTAAIQDDAITGAKIENNPTPYHLGFILGPRINAGGRVGKCSHGANLLLNEIQKKLLKLLPNLKITILQTNIKIKIQIYLIWKQW